MTQGKYACENIVENGRNAGKVNEIFLLNP